MLIKFYTILAFLFLSNLATNGQTADSALIRKTFEGYKSAILNDRAEEAVKYIDSRTVKYYTDILQIVKNADSATIEGLSLIDKVTVLSLRHKATKEELLALEGTGVFTYAVKNGMVGKNSVAQNSVGEIEISGSFAKGQLIANGTASPLYFHFYNEEGNWKLDLTSLFSVGNMALKEIIADSGEDENEVLFLILEALNGKKPRPDIWNKL